MQRPFQRSNAASYGWGVENGGFSSEAESEFSRTQYINRQSQAQLGKYGFDVSHFRLPTAIQPSVYEVDHLVTLDVGTKSGVLSHADGIRKLLQLEATSGVWTRRVLLSIDQRELVVTERVSGDELESFPISQITDPLSYTDGKITNVYNNLVIFIVQRESWTKQPSTMNIFQCIGVKAEEVVDDIKAACRGKFPRPKILVDQIDNNKVFSDSESEKGAQKETTGFSNGSEEPLSGVALANRVVLLNLCFDDIEGFIRQVQKSATEQKEAINKGTDPAHQPSKRDFVDTLQKFKLSLNLIAELRNILQSPSAGDLLHSLFMLLDVVVKVCMDRNGEPKFVENIVSPLLTSSTCRFLEKNLHKQEHRLWLSLGGAWTIPRETWTGPAPSNYAPKFRSSSAPKGSEDLLYSTPRKNLQSRVIQQDDSTVANGSRTVTIEIGERTENENKITSQQTFLDELRANNSRICVVTHARQSKDVRELTVQADEFLEVLEDSKNWWKVKNSRRETGYAPRTILRPYSGF